MASAEDTERRDALERTIRHRLPACDEAELRVIDAALSALERARDVPWFLREPLPSIVREVRVQQPDVAANVLPVYMFEGSRHTLFGRSDDLAWRCTCGAWSFTANGIDDVFEAFARHAHPQLTSQVIPADPQGRSDRPGDPGPNG